eukprot:s7714_g2.t1
MPGLACPAESVKMLQDFLRSDILVELVDIKCSEQATAWARDEESLFGMFSDLQFWQLDLKELLTPWAPPQAPRKGLSYDEACPGPHLPTAPGPVFAVPSQLDAHRERGLSGTVCSALCAFGVVCAGMAYRKVLRSARGATQGHVVATSPAQDLAGTDAAFQQGAAHEANGEIQEAPFTHTLGA